MRMNLNQLVLAAIGLASMPALSGVLGNAFVPATSAGVRISCANPQQVLGAVRTTNSTTVFQAGPEGVRWQVELPPMANDFDYFWFAPDGRAAVVALSVWVGTARAFLVTGRSVPVEIDGLLDTVDFQRDRALVATHVLDADGKKSIGTRVRVYDLVSGQVVGDSRFQDELWATHDVDQQFTLRLAEDGRTYYYLRWTPSAGDELVVRDVESGALRVIHDNSPAAPVVVDNTIPNVGIQDALLYAGRGYMIAGGKLHAIEGTDLVAIETPQAMGRPVKLLESADDARQVVVGERGWGVLDTRDSRWLLVEPGGYAELQPGEWAVIVRDMSLHTPGIRAYDVSAPQPRLARSLAGPIEREGFLCANAFGYLSHGEDGFQWHRTVEHP